MTVIRTRIAPAPTGHFHIGNARTALFNYLFAKKQGGAFVIRIEDTDRERSKKEFEAEILDSLEWLGIAADEGPRSGGPYGPYRQSERLDSYGAGLEKLLAQGQAFFCLHSESELEAEKRTLMAAGKNPVHRCDWRDRGAGGGEGELIRFKTPDKGAIVFQDLIRGEISFDTGLLGDFSIAKDMKTPLYNLAAVMDDREMKISHVIRGEDHISNTPKQMLVWQALWPDEPMPQYAHLPLILGPDRAKLSSRHGATAISEFREQGYLSETVVNFMALMGWNPGGGREIFSIEELIEEFDLGKVQKSGAVFNIEKLDWLNGEYIRKKSLPELVELCRPYLKDFFQTPISKPQFPSEYIEKVIALEQPRLKKLSEIGEKTDYFFRAPEYDKELLRWKNMTDDEILGSLTSAKEIIEAVPESGFSAGGLEKIFLAAIEAGSHTKKFGVGAGDKGRLLWPLRAALSGKKASPGPFEIMAVLGKKRTIERLKAAEIKI